MKNQMYNKRWKNSNGREYKLNPHPTHRDDPDELLYRDSGTIWLKAGMCLYEALDKEESGDLISYFYYDSTGDIL